jgi:2-dehydropantoate 2-reductase
LILFEKEGFTLKIAILGAGALGSVIGAHLARAGEQVTFIARGQRAQFLRERGITVTGSADFTVPATVVTRPDDLKEADVLLVAVKAYDTESALLSVHHLEVDTVLSIQNGVFKDEQLARSFGPEKTIGAAALLAGEIMPDGHVHFTRSEALYLGELPVGTSERVQLLAAILDRSGIHAVVSPQIRTVEWSKYVGFASLMAVAALTRLQTYKIFKTPELACAVAMLLREMAQLAEKLCIPLEDSGVLGAKTLTNVSMTEAIAIIRQHGERMEAGGATGHKVSTLQDLERGRRTEVEEILGYAVRKGAELGVRMSTLETCYRLLAGINDHLR